ncbi:MAG: hypothetical protein RLY47_493 [Candidatus Parcubacteria bacterium]
MNDDEEIERLLSSLLALLDEKALAKMLGPCTKLRFNIEILRGQDSVHIDGSRHPTHARHIDLSTGESPNEELWKRIFALRAFSENPERPGDKKLRRILLEIKQNGHISYTEALAYQAPINGILEGSEIPARMIYERNHTDKSMNGLWIRAIV